MLPCPWLLLEGVLGTATGRHSNLEAPHSRQHTVETWISMDVSRRQNRPVRNGVGSALQPVSPPELLLDDCNQAFASVVTTDNSVSPGSLFSSRTL